MTLFDVLADGGTTLDPVAPYDGRAPLHFTVDYYSPADLAAAIQYRQTSAEAERLEWPETMRNGRSRMWEPAIAGGTGSIGRGHTLHEYKAELRCMSGYVRPYPHSKVCSCVGGYITMAICEPCSWHVIGAGSQAIAWWHDHAFPGWRDLPIVPEDVRPIGGGLHPKKAMEKGQAKEAREWIDAHYPAGWAVDGAPVVTERSGYGTRSVPFYSPWDGYDMSDTDLQVPERAA